MTNVEFICNDTDLCTPLSSSYPLTLWNNCGDVEEEVVLMTSQLWYCLLLYLPSLPPSLSSLPPGFLSSFFLLFLSFAFLSSSSSLPPPCSLSLLPSSTGELKILTKGDNNYGDDREGHIYAPGQNWVTRGDIIGRARG